MEFVQFHVHYSEQIMCNNRINDCKSFLPGYSFSAGEEVFPMSLQDEISEIYQEVLEANEDMRVALERWKNFDFSEEENLFYK